MSESPLLPHPVQQTNPVAFGDPALSAAEIARLEQLRETFEAIPDAVVVVDRDWRFVFANRLAADLTGRPDMAGHNIFEIFPGNREDPFHSAYQATMQHRTVSEFEAFHVAPLNLWLRVLSKPYRDGIIVFFSDITARKNAETREQDTARRLAEVLEVTSDGVASLDRQWRYTYLNANAERLIDPERKLLGKVLWEEFPLAIGGPAWEIYHRSMNQRLPGYVEIYYPAPINAWLALSSRPSDDGIVVFFQDITERKTQDDIVRAQFDLLQTVQTAARVATWDYDVDAGLITYGPGAFPVAGHPLERLTTFDALSAILLPGQQEQLLAQGTKALTDSLALVAEFAVKAPDGSTLWIESRGEVSQVDGRTRIRGMSIDVTRRHLSQIETDRKRDELESIYATTPVALALLDPIHFTFLNLNEHEAALLGQPREKLLGRPLVDLAPPDKIPGLLELLHKVATGHTVRDQILEGELADRPGEHRSWNVNYAPIFHEDGSVRAISTASLEITHQRRAEAALMQSEKLAAVGRLASSISHEINNPLEAITNLLYLIALDPGLPKHSKSTCTWPSPNCSGSRRSPRKPCASTARPSPPPWSAPPNSSTPSSASTPAVSPTPPSKSTRTTRPQPGSSASKTTFARSSTT